MESFHSHSRLSKFKSKLLSEWEAFRKVRVATATRTFSKGSSGQFMKKVSGLLKFDNNSTHDAVPGMLNFGTIFDWFQCIYNVKNLQD